MKKMFSILVVILTCMIILGALGLAVFLRSLPDDIPPFDDSDLLRPAETLPDDQNAFIDYVSAAEAVHLPDDRDRFYRVRDKEEWDDDFVTSILASNSQCLAHVKQGNAKGRCLAPRVTQYNTMLAYIPGWLHIGSLLDLKARLAMRQHKQDEALDAISDALTFASICQADSGESIQYLTADNIQEMTLDTVSDIVRSSVLKSKHLHRLNLILQRNPPLIRGLVLTWQTEYEMHANLATSLAAGEFPVDSDNTNAFQQWLLRHTIRLFLHPNRVKHDVAMFYRELIDQATNTYAQMHNSNVNKFLINATSTAESPFGFNQFQIPNQIDNIFYTMPLHGSLAMMQKKYKRQASYRATILITALHEFKNNTGQYPSTLDELVPTMLPAIPVDPYDGKPMRYVPSEGIVYSVGDDLVDSGGSRKPLPHKPSYNKKQPATEDIVFNIDNAGKEAPSYTPGTDRR